MKWKRMLSLKEVNSYLKDGKMKVNVFTRSRHCSFDDKDFNSFCKNVKKKFEIEGDIANFKATYLALGEKRSLNQLKELYNVGK